MHNIEPWHGWKDDYSAEQDKKSPFYGIHYDEFQYSTKIYNYYIHPLWDDIGSETLYVKILYVSYKRHFAIIELIGEWNDGISNDSMFLKRELADYLIKEGVYKFVLFCDNVLNFHADDDSYYEEWYDDIKEDGGWICLVNTMEHVELEMNKGRLYYYVNYGEQFSDLDWRRKKPAFIVDEIEQTINQSQKYLD